MAAIAAGLAGAVICAAALVLAAPAWAMRHVTVPLAIPSRAEQLVVVSSPTGAPPGPQAITTLRAYTRTSTGLRGRWHLVLGPWQAETGSGHLMAAARRREGDGATPTGVFSIGATMYGNAPYPGGLGYGYHRLVCGDWWDEDPYSPRYNRFVHVPCGITPGFARWSEALWTEARAYPYFAVIDFNTGPIRAGSTAPGSGIFLHSWIGGATHGCIALPRARLLAVLRWLRPARHPVVEIGTDAELAPVNASDPTPKRIR